MTTPAAAYDASLPVVLVLGPSREAVSGVTTHVNLLLESRLKMRYRLVHFQVGSEGRKESGLQRLLRLALGPAMLGAAILRRRASVVHINMSFNAKAYWRDLANLAVAKLCGARVVYQKHGGELAEFVGNGLFAGFVRATLRWPDAIVVLSRREMREYEEFVPGQLVLAVPNGVDPAIYGRLERAAPQPEAPPRLLYIGRLASHKGVSETLDALAILRAKGLRPQLLIAGTGPDEARLRAKTVHLQLDDQVTFLGRVWGERKTGLLQAADVLLLPSYTEGLPYSLLEGMAAGLVPVVTPVGSIPEVVSERLHARLVPMKDAHAIARAIAWLDNERAELARMSRACQERIATGFTVERLAANFTRLYAQFAVNVARRAPVAAPPGPRW